MTTEERISKYKSELSRIEESLNEQDRYASLTAQGSFGSETRFTDVEKLYRRAEWLENRITVLRNSL